MFMSPTCWGLVVAMSLYLCECDGPGKQAVTGQAAAPSVDPKTVEFVERSENEVREQMARWAREGWNLHSISKPMPQADGTVIRRAEISRRTP